jgi:hypothetical protein
VFCENWYLHFTYGTNVFQFVRFTFLDRFGVKFGVGVFHIMPLSSRSLVKLRTVTAIIYLRVYMVFEPIVCIFLFICIKVGALSYSRKFI